jgi:phospholipase D
MSSLPWIGIKKFFIAVIIITASISTASFSQTLAANTHYDVCFTPGEDCTTEIIEQIQSAKQSIYVQAYSFTSAPIALALIDAQNNKKVDVNVILDKSQIKDAYSMEKNLIANHVPLWIDYRPAIAHNKIIIIDEKIVITGSFNFTKSAQERNAENVLIIHDAGVAKLYFDNWNKRKVVSSKVTD